MDRKLTAILSQHDRERKQGFLLGLFRHGAWSLQLGTGESWEEVWAEKVPLVQGEWAFLTATYTPATGEMKLYHNGEEAACRRIPGAGSCPRPPLICLSDGTGRERLSPGLSPSICSAA
ncbi:LamG domain-containing protein [Paenibacillus sp. CC-CFT747]|nr:LamG domain-containing protein [Paenibacillus sp. CC-CFT747]